MSKRQPRPSRETPRRDDAGALHRLGRRHLQFGWWTMLVFLTLGAVLESMHGFKVGWYLDATNETRRLLWTLAHAHGTLVAIVHIVFGLSAAGLAAMPGGALRLASRGLYAAQVLLPGGFLLGGIFIYEGDPGLPILLVPLGALMLILAVTLTARGMRHYEPPGADSRS